MATAQEIIDAIQPDGVAAMLLSEGFGATKKIQIKMDELKNFKLFYLKDYLCGLLKIDNGNEDLFLVKDFNDQGIDLEIVLSQFKEVN